MAPLQRRSLLALMLLLLTQSFEVLAQQPEGGEHRENPFADPIETDRDSFTPATKTVGKGSFIFESGWSFIDNRGFKETNSFPESLLRYGLTERLELRFGWNYEVGGAGSDVSGNTAGEDDFASASFLEREFRIAYGFKFQTTEQRSWVPESAIIFQGSTPTTGPSTDTQFVGTFVFGWKLPNRWKLDSALRYGTASEEEDRFDIWAPSVVLKVPVGERVNIHAEYFSLFSTNQSEDFAHHFFSPGVHYLITPNLEVGVRLGWGLNDQSARFFSNVGFGYRF